MTPPTLDVISVPANPEDDSDIFGPPRTTLFRSNRPRVSMISAKLRAKEERKKVIQICTEKLERIKDPDMNLRRSVCINNTYYKLQDEVRREKQNKLMNNNYHHHHHHHHHEAKPPIKTKTIFENERLIDNDLEKIDKELSALNDSLDQEMTILNEELTIKPSEEVLRSYQAQPKICLQDSLDDVFKISDVSRKRTFEDVDDRIVQEVLSHFYNQPTTKLLTTIEEDAMMYTESKKMKMDNEYVDILNINTDLNQNKTEFETLNDHKKLKFDDFVDVENNYDDGMMKNSDKTEFEIILDALRLNNDSKDIAERENMLSLSNQGQDYDNKQRFMSNNSNLDSCGQAAIYAELQSTVFHNLMASLET